MYTKRDLEIIVSSCQCYSELLKTLLCFKYLVDNRYMVRSLFLYDLARRKFKILGTNYE